jgi:regulatory protein
MRRSRREPDTADTSQELNARALRLLARREHSRAELVRKLAPHAESREALERLLDELVVKKQLSEERYVEQRAHVLARKYGAGRVLKDLRAKGINEEAAGRAATLAATGDLERAHAILARKYRAPAASREERAKRARFLLGRGFDHEVIRRALALADDNAD